MIEKQRVFYNWDMTEPERLKNIIELGKWHNTTPAIRNEYIFCEKIGGEIRMRSFSKGLIKKIARRNDITIHDVFLKNLVKTKKSLTNN